MGPGDPAPTVSSEPSGEGPWPAWFDGVLVDLELRAERILDAKSAWNRYELHRKKKRLPPEPHDASWWLMTVIVAEQQQARTKARDDQDRRTERDEKAAKPAPFHHVIPREKSAPKLATLEDLSAGAAAAAAALGGRS